MADIESKVRLLRPHIVRCIKDPSIVTELASRAVFGDDVCSSLHELYAKRTSVEATEAMMDALFNSTSPGKMQAFLESLQTDFKQLKKYLECPLEFDCKNERHRAMIRLFRTELVKQLDIHDGSLVVELTREQLITHHDEEEITTMCQTQGHSHGVILLLARMQCHLPDDEWYYKFLLILERNNYVHIIEQMDPEFLTCPSKYMPKLGPILTRPGDVPVNQSGQTAMDVDGAGSSSVTEHVMTDYQSADISNDLNAPPQNSSTTDSVVTKYSRTSSSEPSSLSSKYSVDSLDNLKEYNIKPETSKCVFTERDKVAGTGYAVDTSDVESDTSDDTNSLASDVDGSDIEDEEESAPEVSLKPKSRLTLRDYQLELAENSILGRNTIICAETGTGKTWVALHIIEQHLSNTACNGPRRVTFMARTGLLIKQQANRLMKHLPQFRVKLITGEEDDSMYLDAFLPENDILCFTPQILVNNIERGNVKSLSEFSLIILDECHHTKGDSPYTNLMRKYLIERQSGCRTLPQVVGLTASLGVGNSRTEEESVNHILRVCACLDTRMLSTVERCKPSLAKWVNMPPEETIKMEIQDPDPCKATIITAMENIEETMEDYALMQPSLIDLMDKQPRDRECQEYNKWTVEVAKTSLLDVTDHDISRNIIACATYLNVYNAALEVNNLLQTKDIVRYLATKHKGEVESREKLTDEEKTLLEELIRVQKKLNKIGRDQENRNVRTVSDLLAKLHRNKGDDSRALVFVKTRETCRALAAFLDKDLQRYGIRTSPLYGKEARAGDEGMTESMQTDILEKFKQGMFKVVVCTSVGTEGIDVPDCNIVINYNYSGDEITKIQMKGRSRKQGATHVIVGSEKQVQQETINAYKAAMMYRAMSRVQSLQATYINSKVEQFQQEEMGKYRYRMESMRARSNRRSEDDFEIRCKRCNVLACMVSDVRKLGHDHLVVDTTFSSKITTKPHKKPRIYDGIEKKAKMYCKKCPLDWGIIADRKGTELRILKIVNFKFRNIRTKDVTTYGKWIDMPYNVCEIGLEDIPTLYGVAVEIYKRTSE